MWNKILNSWGNLIEYAAERFLLLCMILIPLIISIVFIYLYSDSQKTIHLRLSSGSPHGTNFVAAEQLSNILKEHQTAFHITPQMSLGSIDNLEKVKNRETDLAFIQSDMPESADIRTVLPLHHEILHILVRKDSKIDSFKDLENKKLHLGLPQSGSRHLALKLFRHFGMNFNESYVNEGEMSTTGQNLLNKNIDAILFVAGLKPKLCDDLIQTGEIKLIGLNPKANSESFVNGFVLDHPFIHPYSIPAGSYTVRNGSSLNQPEVSVPTISVRSTLVVHESVPSQVIYQLLTDIFKWRPSLIRSHPTFYDLNEKFDQQHLPYPLHEGADLFFNRDRPGFWRKNSDVLSLLLSSMIALIGLCTGLSNWLKRRRKEHLDAYYQEIDRRIQDIKIAKEAERSTKLIKESLFDLKQRVIKDLISDRVEAGDGFRTLLYLITECENSISDNDS